MAFRLMDSKEFDGKIEDLVKKCEEKIIKCPDMSWIYNYKERRKFTYREMLNKRESPLYKS